MSIIKYWIYIFIINILLFNFLYFLKAQYGDVLGFAFAGSLMVSVPSLLVCIAFSYIIRVLKIDILNFIGLLINLSVGMVTYLIFFEIIDEPFLLDLIKGNLSDMKTYFYSSAIVSLFFSIIIVTSYLIIIRKKASKKKEV